jgi:hypothetical protein
MLQTRVKRLFRGNLNTEHIYLFHDLVESYKETFYSHHTRATRDVRKAAHMKYFDGKPVWLCLTNKDPLELTDDWAGKYAAAETPQQKKQILIAAYKHQELHGGPSTNHTHSLELPADSIVFDSKDLKREKPENWVPVEQLELTGDHVFVPHEHRTGMEHWDRELQKMANEFLGLSFRYAPSSWNQNRLVSWYEQILQEDALIEREGGVSRLTDTQLKVALLDRSVMRFEEDLTRTDMEARYKEISWLMGQRLSPAVILSWQTGFYRATYSPEEDLPEASILPKFNRSRLDVDVHNALAPDARNDPLQVTHPALFPESHRILHKEL